MCITDFQTQKDMRSLLRVALSAGFAEERNSGADSCGGGKDFVRQRGKQILANRKL